MREVAEMDGQGESGFSAHQQFEVELIGDAALSISKRALDIVISGLLLVFLLPILCLIAALIRLTSSGPILFRQQRTGLNAVPFTVFKFRTMYVHDHDHHVRQATRGDRRVTPIGGLLRASSVDELPQLLNVLRGDMSLVGPRPHAVAHDRLYGDALDTYHRRFAVRPGLTGLAQVRGLRGEIRTIDCIERRLLADHEYIDRWSLGTDLAILLRTVPLLVRDPNAY